MKFLLDENVHKGLYSFLYKLGYDVKLCPKSIENGEVFKLSLSEQRLLITRDKRFIDNPYSSFEHLGVWLLRIRPKDLETQKLRISELLEQFSPEEFKCKVIILSDENFEFLG